jgi:hypothetical protein
MSRAVSSNALASRLGFFLVGTLHLQYQTIRNRSREPFAIQLKPSLGDVARVGAGRHACAKSN